MPKHWLERLMKEYGIDTRYQIQEAGGPTQQTTYRWIVANNKIENTPARSIKQLAIALAELSGEPLKDVLENIFKNYVK